MKLAYFGGDLFIGCIEVWLAQHHDIVAVFTSASAQDNKKIRAYAASRQIQCIAEKPTKQHIQALVEMGVECFFSIEYEYLIPLPDAPLITLNMHPSLLPAGRGATPLSHIILRYPEYAGISFHKLSARFDEGDIVLQSSIQLDHRESLESLMVKLDSKIPALLNELLVDLAELYKHAKPQQGGSYWPKISLQDRLLNWQDPMDKIDRMIRAFGRFGVIACIHNEAWELTHAQVHNTQHTALPGTLLSDDDKICVVAVAGGIVVIYKDSIIERRDLGSL